METSIPIYKKENYQVLDVIEETHEKLIKIIRVKEVASGKEYVLKEIEKKFLDESQMRHLNNEKTALWELNHPCINQLVSKNNDDDKFYLLLEIVYGSPLHKIMNMSGGRLRLNYVKFICVQILLILQHMHQNGFIYRDLKASNIILNSNGKVTLIDLGFCQKIGTKGRTNSICGTQHAMAPEFFNQDLLQAEGYSFDVDFYALGILIYELLMGKPPLGYFPKQENLKLGIQLSFLKDDLQIFKDESLQNFVCSLLQRKTENRLGNQEGVDEILANAFFNQIDITQVQQFAENDGPLQNYDDYEIGFYAMDIQDFGLREGEGEYYAEDDDPFKELD